MDDVTSMSLEGTLMALTHSILINLFIKLELKNFLLPPLLSTVFVQECSVSLQILDEGRLGRRTFFAGKIESLDTSLTRAQRLINVMTSAILGSCVLLS